LKERSLPTTGLRSASFQKIQKVKVYIGAVPGRGDERRDEDCREREVCCSMAAAGHFGRLPKGLKRLAECHERH